jgi:hypothetical protein
MGRTRSFGCVTYSGSWALTPKLDRPGTSTGQTPAYRGQPRLSARVCLPIGSTFGNILLGQFSCFDRGYVVPCDTTARQQYGASRAMIRLQ